MNIRKATINDLSRIAEIYVDPFFQSKGIGKELIEYAINELHADNLWALEKNTPYISKNN